MSEYVLRTKCWTLKCKVLHSYAYWQGTFAVPIFIRIIKVLDLQFQGQRFELSTDRTTIVISNTESRKWSFDLHIYIWLWPILKVKVMHTSTVNISQMVIERVNITIANKQKVAFTLSIGILYWPISKVEV